MLDDNGVWLQDTEMRNHITGYFSNLFTSQVAQPNPDVLSLVRREVTDEMNIALLAPYMVEEVQNEGKICPRGNNKVVIYISLYHDKCLLFMLELY